ncbi:MAG: hypothetical protein ING51_11610 [Rhodocyclaceae bacterium]|nr:hypothetical protein [Rhodocyclaceae bacterium]
MQFNIVAQRHDCEGHDIVSIPSIANQKPEKITPDLGLGLNAEVVDAMRNDGIAELRKIKRADVPPLHRSAPSN